MDQNRYGGYYQPEFSGYAALLHIGMVAKWRARAVRRVPGDR
jgi:hypothetical protein